MSSNNFQTPTSPSNSSPRPMQAYQQFLQQQQEQQRQQQSNPAVWSPSVPNYAAASAPPQSPSNQYNISGPLDLKTSGVQPILPPIKDVQPRSNIPSRNTSLRRHPSQNGLHHQQSAGSLNQSFNGYDSLSHIEEDGDHQDSPGSDQRPYFRAPSGHNSTTSSVNSSEYIDNKAASPGDSAPLTASSYSGLQRSNSKINYSSPLLRSQSRSGSSSPSSPSQSPLKRQTSILKNGSKDAPYLTGAKNFHGADGLSHTWEPASSNPASATSTSPPPSQFGSASNLRALVAAAAAATASASASSNHSSLIRNQEISETTSSSLGEGPGSRGATLGNDGAQSAQPSRLELKDSETPHIPVRDSANYKVLVPSPVASPSLGPSAGGAGNMHFGFLSSDPTLQRSTSRRRMAPPIQVQPGQLPPGQLPPGQFPQNPQPLQSMLSPQSLASPISPSRRFPNYRRENPEVPGKEHEQGQGQGYHEDGDYEDEGLNDDTDGDGLSGPEDQSERRRRQRQKPGDNAPFSPSRSAPQSPSPNASGIPNTREAELAHIKYIQQQQALFLQEKANNPPLRTKGSNGNLSSDGSKPRRKSSHRKQISVISEPKLVSSTNHIKTVPIVRPADQSDNDDAGTKSEYTSGGEGIKKTVRKMRKAVRHAANGVFNDDDSDRDEALGSKSDAEKKGGLKQLKALKSKLAKRLHRPGHGGGSSARQDEENGNEGEGSRGPVQFFSEDNLRARYLAQEQESGNSFAALGASLRRSNTTRDTTAGFARRNQGDGDKQEYEDENEDEEEDGDPSQATQETGEDADAKAKKAKFTSRTFDKDEMIEVNDGTGESFFLPRWDLDPRADELDSSKSVISVQPSRKLERSASSSTTASVMTNKPTASIAERLQGTTVIEENENSSQNDGKPTDSSTPTPTKESAAESFKDSVKAAQADREGLSSTVTTAPEDNTSDANNNAGSVSSSSERASVLSETSSAGGVVVAQVLTRQSSMRKTFTRPTVNENSKDSSHDQSASGEPVQQQGPGDNEKPLPIPPQEVSSETKGPANAIVRPLSPIRRGTINSGRSASIASVSSLISGSSTTDLKKTISIGSLTLPQAPSSPLPSPSAPTNSAPPTTPFPAVLLRQGSNLTERASLRSMYADSIYDYYDYDSASEYGSQIGDQQRFERQGSFSSTLTSGQDGVLASNLSTISESETKTGANITTAVATLDRTKIQTLSVSLNGSSKDVTAEGSLVTPTAATGTMSASEIVVPGIDLIPVHPLSTQEIKIPSIPEDPVDSKKETSLKEEEQHVHYEDIPKAVAYRMSMMKTVPVDPVGVAASLSLPSRPPRHPMRYSRQGSLSSDFTSDSWISSARNTRDDMSGWDTEQGSEQARRPSVASSLSRFNSVRNERSGSMMTDSRIVEEKEHEVEGMRGDNKLSSRRNSETQHPLDPNVPRTQWYNGTRRETWGSIQSSSSDSASSSSSSRSSHFYFNGKSPSPSPTEESARAAGNF